MRKSVLTLVVGAALMAPAGALAHNGSDDGNRSAKDATEVSGTVKSFDADVLTLTLGNGDTISGRVTRRTEIRCGAAKVAKVSRHGDDDGPNHDAGDDRGGDRKDDARGDDHGKRHGHHFGRKCASSNLTAGTVVREAELRTSSAGNVFREVKLVK